MYHHVSISLDFSLFSTCFLSLPLSYFLTPFPTADVLLRPLCHLLSTALTAGNRQPSSVTTTTADIAAGDNTFPANHRSSVVPPRYRQLYFSYPWHRRDHCVKTSRTPPIPMLSPSGSSLEHPRSLSAICFLANFWPTGFLTIAANCSESFTILR